MRRAEAEAKIKTGLKKGYIIQFTRIVSADSSVKERIPELGEKLFKTESDAWDFAKKLAEKSVGEYVRFYVVDSHFKPVGDYKSKMIDNHK